MSWSKREHPATDLYGFQGQKWIRVKGHYEHDYFYARVPDDFKLDYITDYKTVWRDPDYCEGLAGYNISWRCDEDLNETINVRAHQHQSYWNLSPSPPPFGDTNLYKIVDTLLDTADTLELEHELSDNYNHEEILELADRICEQAINQNRQLELLRGKDILELVQTLDSTKLELAAAKQETKDEITACEEVEDKLKRCETENTKLLATIEVQRKELERLRTERDGYKEAVLTKVKAALASI